MWLLIVCVVGRITPAGAGKTKNPSSNPLWAGDHPRRCGENYNLKLFGNSDRGSPPQVRGKLKAECERLFELGITPAGAGKTGHDNTFAVATPDHPRRCGENWRYPASRQAISGSPPQVRGKRI